MKNSRCTIFFLIFNVCFGIGCTSLPDTWEDLGGVTSKHLRGLSVRNDDIMWASGTAGTFIKTVNGGKNWTVGQIPGCDSTDLRDIEAHDERMASVMTAGWPARIFRTYDGGLTWNLQMQDTTPGTFLDGMAFWDEQHGVAYGDPIAGNWYILRTMDGGQSWYRANTTVIPPPQVGEAGFAASGTGITVGAEGRAWFGTGGGETARTLLTKDFGKTWQIFNTPIRSEEGAGIFSLCFANKAFGVAVGGSYTDSTNTSANCAVTENGGDSWEVVSSNPPGGYRSCVAYHATLDMFYAVGRTGSDYSIDRGRSWTPHSPEGYYTCAFSKSYLWVVGRNGKMARLKLPEEL